MVTTDNGLPTADAASSTPPPVTDGLALACLHCVQGVQETVLAARMLADSDAGMRRRLVECAVGTVLDHLMAPDTLQHLVPLLARRALRGQLLPDVPPAPPALAQLALQLDCLFCDLFALVPGAPVSAARVCLDHLLVRLHGRRQAQGGGAEHSALRQRLLAGVLSELAASAARAATSSVPAGQRGSETASPCHR